jgi:hypothetical protein
MIDLKKLFENWFADEKITKTRLTNFARQHLLAVEADNAGGDYDDIIAATEPLLTTVENCLTDRTTKAGIEKGRVQAKDLFRDTLAEKLRKLHAAVAVVYGDPSPDLTMCFPSGRKVFGDCKDEDLGNNLEQLKNALTERSAAVGATHVTTITNLCTQWTALYTQRWEADASTDLSAAGQLAAVNALKEQLYKNVHTVAVFNLGNMEACGRLCPQHLLFPAGTASVPEGAQVTSLTGGAGEWTGTAEAVGATLMRWFTRPAGSSDDFVEAGTSEPAEEFTLTGVAGGSHEVKVQGENSAGVGPQSEVSVVGVS